MTTAVKKTYGYSRTFSIPFDVMLERTQEALKGEGFGILCEIDVKQKMREKLGVEFRNYMILGACNPPLAYQTLQKEIDIGLLLPCNVIVYEEGINSVVSAIDAAKMLSVVGNPELESTADLVNEKLRRVIDRL